MHFIAENRNHLRLFHVPVFESSHLPHHVHLDGDFTTISKRHSRDVAHRRFLDLSTVRPLRRTPFCSEVATLHHPSLHLLHVQHLLRRTSGEQNNILSNYWNRNVYIPMP